MRAWCASHPDRAPRSPKPDGGFGRRLRGHLLPGAEPMRSQTVTRASAAVAATACAAWFGACSSGGDAEPVIQEGICQLAEGQTSSDYLRVIGCRRDFEALASEPLDTSLPGARSVKVVLD